MGVDVARVGGRVAGEDGLARFGGGSGDALAHGEALHLDAFVVALAEEADELFAVLVDLQDDEGVEVDEGPDALGDFDEELVQFEDGRELVGHVAEGALGLVLAFNAAV